jgi:hypothetical protein
MFCSCNVTVLSALSCAEYFIIVYSLPCPFCVCGMLLYVILCFVLVMLLFFMPFPLLCSIFHYCMPSLAPSLWDISPFPLLYSIFHYCMLYLATSLNTWDVFCSWRVSHFLVIYHDSHVEPIPSLWLSTKPTVCPFVLSLVPDQLNQQWAYSLKNIYEVRRVCWVYCYVRGYFISVMS